MSADADLTQPDVIMRLTGHGGAELLHGQTTANFKQLVPGEHRYAAFCNPKGRVLADIRAVMISDELILLRGRLTVMHQLSRAFKAVSYVCPRAARTDGLADCRLPVD